MTRGWRVVAEDFIREIVTERGTNPIDPERGLGMGRVVFAATEEADLPAYASDIQSALEQDERVSSVDATVTLGPTGKLEVTINVDLAAGPSFRLVGPISVIRAELVS